ncbi:MAG: hypothetical protein ACI934_001378 [Pseudohongiellaceae bacterium]|jgi:hypothetical protein
MSIKCSKLLGIALIAFLLAACGTRKAETLSYASPIQDDLFLDVGVCIFDFAPIAAESMCGVIQVEENDEKEDTEEVEVEAEPEAVIKDPVQLAESRYIPYMLVQTLQRSARWDRVRVIPNNAIPLDVKVQGTIVQSNGQTLELQVNVSDATGREWYTRTYELITDESSYTSEQLQKNEPFQVVYNNIANDLLSHRQRNISPEQIIEIKTVSTILFAERFSPGPLGTYITSDRRGIYHIASMPAPNNPLLLRVREIHERDSIFIDTLQDYFANYAAQVRKPYDSWREQSYHEIIASNRMRDPAESRFINSTAALLGGLATPNNTDRNRSEAEGTVGARDDAQLIKSGFDKQSQARANIATLEILGQALNNELPPRVITLENQAITLDGISIEEQYSQWREELLEIYPLDALEIAKPETPNLSFDLFK